MIVLALSLLSVAATALADNVPPPVDLPTSAQVNQGNINETICAIGWTQQVRPSYGYTREVKLRKLHEKGLSPADARRYELDHLIPLSLGGDPYAPSNLALEPWAEAREKDSVEGCLTAAVCSGDIKLAAAQREIWEDWRHSARLCTR